MRRYVLFGGLGLALGLLVMAAFVYAQPYTFRGSHIEPPYPAPNFTLYGSEDQPYTLAEQQGKVVVLFFGFTSCPDVCPTTMSEMKQARARLKAQADDVQFVLITVDPERDSPQRMGEYAASFDPSFIGLSGTESELEPVWKAYGVYREKRENNTQTGYTMDHSAYLYVIDRDGHLRETFSFGASIDDVVSDLRYLIKE